MNMAVRLRVDVHSPIPIRWQLSEQLKHAIEGGGVPREQALPSIRELAGFLGINPNTVARAIEDLKQSGYVEARRGKGVFVASAPPTRPSPTPRQDFLKDAVIRGAALGMTPGDVAAGVLSVADVGLAALGGTAEVLVVECSAPELDFFARELQAHLPVRAAKVLLRNMARAVGRQRSRRQWVAAVTSFAHLPEVERRLDGLRIPVLALLAEVHLETLQRLAQLPAGTRVGVVAAAVETSHTLEHSITAAALPNIARVETCAAAGLALGRLVRRVDVIVCSTSAAGRVHGLVGATVPVIIDDRALNQRAIQMLGAIVAQHDGGPPTPDARGSPTAVRFALAPRRPREGATPEDGGAVVRQRNDGKRRRRVRGSEGSMAEAGVGDDAR